MQQKDIDYILASIKAPIDHLLFYPRVYALAAKYRKNQRKTAADVLSYVMTEEYEEFSRRLNRSQIQESCSVRNVLRARQLAQFLIDEKGELNHSLIPEAIAYLQKHLYSLGPQRQYDGKRQEHLLKVLHLLNTDKDLVRLLKKFTRPYSNKWAEDLIRHTLQLAPTTVVTDAHTRQAVLSAWFCYLRQNVGSCFATAPAEIIHDEQPEFFLHDLLDLIALGRLKRTFGGVEISVPLSASWGSGDLKKPLLIQQTSKGIQPEIWHSPGFAAVFEAVGFLKKGDRAKLKAEQIEGWVKPLLIDSHSPYVLITAEEIIRKVLMQNLGITEKQLKEFESRPHGMIHSRLMMHPHQVAKKAGGIGERCTHFLQLLELAKNVFKSLADNALLKAWEFSLASFSDTKYEFNRWNLYASLGLLTNEPGGIGECIHRIIQDKLDVVNRKVQDIQYEYEVAYTQVKTLESRYKHASSEKEAQWLKAEYQVHANELYFMQEQRAEAQHQAEALVSLYDTLYKLYVELFKDYFQEVYDADMQEVVNNPFDDSPAGFRLIYKHGRTNTSQWTLVKNQHEFIDSLADFFVATESQIAHSLEGKKIQKDLSDVVTAIINHVKTKEFLESALHRMAAAHHAPLIKNPLENLDKIEKKPWVYTSGGTMNTLVSSYYKLEEKPKEVEKWVESEMELLVYFADTLKRIPPALLAPFLKGDRQSMLMESPTHAFLLKPVLSPFKECWLHEEYTYTYIRDRFVRPAEMFVERLLLNEEMMQVLVKRLVDKIPENYQPRFMDAFRHISGPLNPIFFRDYMVDMISHDRGLRQGSRPVISSDEIDSLLYSSLPLFPVFELRERIHKMLNLLPDFTPEKSNQILELLNQIPVTRGGQTFITAQQLQDILKGLLCLSEASTTTPYDYHLLISQAAQKLGFAMPAPLIFGDTNWVKEMFGFLVNPGTKKLQLWRLDYTGSYGTPMSNWKQWLDGSRSDIKWGIYAKPYQYGQA